MNAVAIVTIARALVACDKADGEPVTAAAASVDSGDGVEPADPGLMEAFELIDRSIDLMGWDQPNPVALVRAVNHLRSLGKDQAIATLRAYVRYAPVQPDWAKLHAPDQQRLCWIIPLLFAPAHDRVRLPSLGRDPREWSRGGWKQLDISVQADLPFHDSPVTGRLGTLDPPRAYLVEWADRHGVLGEEPLRPSNDPLLAADELAESLLNDDENRSASSRKTLTSHLRLQARRTIEHLFTPDEKKSWDYIRLSDSDWAEAQGNSREIEDSLGRAGTAIRGRSGQSQNSKSPIVFPATGRMIGIHCVTGPSHRASIFAAGSQRIRCQPGRLRTRTIARRRSSPQ
jgi:hypothetical protein